MRRLTLCAAAVAQLLLGAVAPARALAGQETGAPATATGSDEDRPAALAERIGTVAAFDFDSGDPSELSRAQSVGVLVTTRLAQRPGARVIGRDQVRAALTLAAEREAIGPGPGAEVDEVAESVLGARWILHGQVDRFGGHFVLAATLLDARTGLAHGRFRVDAAREDDLPAAADRLGDQIAAALGLPPAPGDAELVSGHEMIGGPVAFLGVKLGQAFARLEGFRLDTLTLNFNLEGDVVLKKWLHAYVEVGVLVGRATSEETQNEGTFSLVPASAGLKLVFFSERALRPFVSLGVGLGYFTALIDSTKGVALRGDLKTGVAWMPWQRVGVIAELGVNVDTELLYGFSWNFGVAFAF